MKRRLRPRLTPLSACWIIGMQSACINASCSRWRRTCFAPYSLISSGLRLCTSFHALSDFLASIKSRRISSLHWSEFRPSISAGLWCAIRLFSTSGHRTSVRPPTWWLWTQTYTKHNSPRLLRKNLSGRRKWRLCLRIEQFRSELTDSSQKFTFRIKA